MTDDFDPEAAARISAELIKALAEAKALSDSGDVGPQFRQIVQHAKKLYDLLLEQLISAGPAVGEEMHGMVTTMGNKLGELEALAEDSPPPAALN